MSPALQATVPWFFGRETWWALFQVNHDKNVECLRIALRACLGIESENEQQADWQMGLSMKYEM